VKIDRDAPSTSSALAPYIPTTAGAGDDEAKDSSTWEAESGDLTEDGDRDPTLDFGFVRPAVSVGDFVWVEGDLTAYIPEGETNKLMGIKVKDYIRAERREKNTLPPGT
jgi:hypothetical protein